MNEHRLDCYPPSFKHRLKHTFCGCFKQHPNHYNHLSDESSTSPTSRHRQNNPHLTRTNSTGGNMSSMIRPSRSEEFNLKDKCRSIINRIGTTTPRAGGGGGGHHHRKSHSTDFRYDPLSYALNFQDEDAYADDDFPFRNFTSRLPMSPPTSSLSVGPPRSVSDGVVVKAALSPDVETPPQNTASSAPPPREITAYS